MIDPRKWEFEEWVVVIGGAILLALVALIIYFMLRPRDPNWIPVLSPSESHLATQIADVKREIYVLQTQVAKGKQ